MSMAQWASAFAESALGFAGQTAESNAFPGWIVLSTAGAAVLVGGIIAGSVISNRKSKDDKR